MARSSIDTASRVSSFGFSRIFALALAALVFAAGARTASAQADFSAFVTFGDSLTHNEILATINDKPTALYGADPMEAVFDKGAVGGDDLGRYAIAGSESGDIGGQIGFYEFLVNISAQDPATLVSIQGGANDMLNNFAILSSNAPGQSAQADAVMDAILDNLKDAFVRMRGNVPGVRFIVWTIPDLTLTPRYVNQLTPTQIANVRAHLERINRKIRRGANRPKVVVLDTDALIAEVVVTPPVLRGQTLDVPPAMCEFDDLFADEIHPTAVSNAMIANETSMGINAKWGDTIPLYTEDELADLAQIP